MWRGSSGSFELSYLLDSMARSIAAPVGVNSQINNPQFTITVNQKTTWKEAFLDLWRKVCWAIIAPGQPPWLPAPRAAGPHCRLTV
jgi:hypothetical protein